LPVDTANANTAAQSAVTSERSAESDEVPSPSVPHQGPRLDYLDGLRAIAALYVLLDHAIVNVYPVWQPQAEATLLANRWAPLAAALLFARYAVAVFIVLSGFCLMLPVMKRAGELSGGATRFFTKRIRRIIPPYYAAIALCALVMTGAHLQNVTVSDIVRHMLLVNDIAGDDSINGAFWSIAVECHIYLVFPVLVLFAARFGLWRIAPVTVALCLAAYYLSYGSIAWQVSPHFLGLFALGALACGIAYGSQSSYVAARNLVPWHTIAAVLLVGLALLSAWRHTAIWHGRPLVGALDLLAGLTAAAVLVAASLSGRNRLRSALEWRPLVVVGGFSYSLYLIHGPILQAIRFHNPVAQLTPPQVLAALVLAVAPLTIAAAYLFHVAFERPFMRMLPEPKAGG